MKRTIHTINYLEETEALAKFAKALGHPTRIKIINYLASKSHCCTGDLCDELPLAQSTISQHLKELKLAGLIQGTVEPPKIKYCIHQKNWETAQELFQVFFNKNISENTCK